MMLEIPFAPKERNKSVRVTETAFRKEVLSA